MESEDQFEKHVAERLKRLRVERGLTLDQLADLSGVSRAMISRIERSEASPTAALLARLCSALGVSLSVFFASAEAEPSPLAFTLQQFINNLSLHMSRFTTIKKTALLRFF